MPAVFPATKTFLQVSRPHSGPLLHIHVTALSPHSPKPVGLHPGFLSGMVFGMCYLQVMIGSGYWPTVLTVKYYRVLCSSPYPGLALYATVNITSKFNIAFCVFRAGSGGCSCGGSMHSNLLICASVLEDKNIYSRTFSVLSKLKPLILIFQMNEQMAECPRIQATLHPSCWN